MQKIKKYLACCFICFANAQAFADDWQLSLEIGSISFSEPIPVKGIINDNWSHPFNGGNNIFSHSHFITAAQKQNWRINLQQRYDYYANFHRDTAELVYLGENHLAVPANRDFTFDLNVKQLRAKGIGVGYQWLVNKQFKTLFSLNYWKPDLVSNGSFQGFVQTGQSENFEAEIRLDYSYTRDQLFERPKVKFGGEGVTVDWQMSWQYNQLILLDLAIRDLYSYFEWPQATYTEALVTSNTTSFDDDGFINFTPTLSGLEGIKTHRQKMPPSYRFNGSYKLDNLSLIGQILHFDKVTFYRMGARFELAKNKQLSWYFDPANHALTAGINGKNLNLELTLDNLSLDKAHLIAFNIFWKF